MNYRHTTMQWNQIPWLIFEGKLDGWQSVPVRRRQPDIRRNDDVLQSLTRSPAADKWHSHAVMLSPRGQAGLEAKNLASRPACPRGLNITAGMHRKIRAQHLQWKTTHDWLQWRRIIITPVSINYIILMLTTTGRNNSHPCCVQQNYVTICELKMKINSLLD